MELVTRLFAVLDEQCLIFWVRLQDAQCAVSEFFCVCNFFLHEQQLEYWVADETPRRSTSSSLFVKISCPIVGFASGSFIGSVSPSEEGADFEVAM